MPGHGPYYIRRGWLDDDGHIRVIESSLKIMHNANDVYGEETTDDDDDSAAGVYTYPAPSEDGNDNSYAAGYFYLGEMVQLVDPMLSSPDEEAAPSPLTSYDDGDSDPVAAVTSFQPDNNSHLLLPPAHNTYSLENISNIYSQTLPYANLQTNAKDGLVPQSRSIAPRHDMPTRHDLISEYGRFATGNLMASLSTATSHVTAQPVMPPTGYAPPVANMTSLPTAGVHNGFAPLATNTASSSTAGLHNAATPAMSNTSFVPIAQNMTYPYRPMPSTGVPILTLPDGPRVGQPVPADLHPIIDAISNLRIIGNTEHPERKILKKPYEGSYQTASRTGQLIRDHFASGSGLLKNDSPLRDWYGDLRVFSAKMWEFLAVQKTRVNVSGKG